jgi:hypothetical protein
MPNAGSYGSALIWSMAAANDSSTAVIAAALKPELAVADLDESQRASG